MSTELKIKSNITFDGESLTPEQIPQPSGWTIVLAPIHIDETTSGGVILIKDDVKAQESVRFVSKVLAMGPLAYTGDKFKPHPNANVVPFCKIGDVVAHGQYTGASLPCKDSSGNHFYLRFMNDDEIKMVIPDLGVIDA